MGERKVLNKYYPPGFDPAKIPRRRQPKNQQMKVRMMLPMSIRCEKCRNYMSQGTKFNSRKEDVVGETYLGIQIFRFYFKCTNCSSEITIKTDPKNSVYKVERGAKRNYETIGDHKDKAEEELGEDAMKSLENRTLESKRETDRIAALDEMKSLKSRQASVSVDAMLEVLQRSKKEKERKMGEEDEALVRSIFKKPKDGFIRRIDDEDFEDDDDDFFFNRSLRKRQRLDQGNPTDVLIKAAGKVASEAKKTEGKQVAASSLQSLCQVYGDSEEDD